MDDNKSTEVPWVLTTNFRGMHGIWPNVAGTNKPICFLSFDPDGPDRGKHCDNWEANGTRIVACVNACDGIRDPSSLRKQRDELLKALKELEDAASGLEADVDSDRDAERNAEDVRYACLKARDLISKVEQLPPE